MGNKWFKKTRIKNYACYYFNGIIKLEDFDLDNILLDKKSHWNTLIYDISYKTLIDSKLLRIRFDKINEFIRIYDGTRYLTLFGSEKYDAIYSRIRLSLKSGITYIFSHYFAKIKVYSYDSLPIEKRLTLYNVIIHIKLLLNKDKNHYYYNDRVYTISRNLNVLEDDIEGESYTVISIDFLLIYDKKFYLQVYLDNYAYKTVNK